MAVADPAEPTAGQPASASPKRSRTKGTGKLSRDTEPEAGASSENGAARGKRATSRRAGSRRRATPPEAATPTQPPEPAADPPSGASPSGGEAAAPPAADGEAAQAAHGNVPRAAHGDVPQAADPGPGEEPPGTPPDETADGVAAVQQPMPRRRRSAVVLPTLVDRVELPEDALGRVELIAMGADDPVPEPLPAPLPAAEAIAESATAPPPGWNVVGVTAAILILLFVIGMLVTR
jgi:hypothetical protein